MYETFQDIEKLRMKLDKEREKLGQSPDESNMLLNQQHKVNTTFSLIPEEAGYLVSVEIPMPIDVVTLQVPLL